ncbi:MAG TPA: hypothetical protein VOA87_09770 [Thermoanaerobaculia bacterium]|nr:hypothetical protein [Thermoanaerobaculia bacterium]
MPDLSKKKDRWKTMLSVNSRKINVMTVASMGVFVGEANGGVELLSLDGASSGNRSIIKGAGYYRGTGTPYSSTITAIGLSAGLALFAGIDGEGIYRYNGALSWSDAVYAPLAPGPFNVTAIATADSGTMFAASKFGIYRADNLTFTWDRVFSTNSFANLSSITIDPSDGAIYVGYGNGILKSTDNGDTWTETASPNTTTGNYPLTNVVDMNVFAAPMSISRSTIFALTPQTLFESTDHGNTWVEDADSLTLPGGRQFTCLAIRGGIGPDIFIGSSTTGVSFKKWATMLSGFTTDNNSNGLYTSRVNACGAYQNGRIYLGTDMGAFMEIN